MSEMRFTKDHEWLLFEDNIVTIGITEHAQDQLGDIVYVELPPIDKILQAGDEAIVIESVKAAADVKVPLSGTVVAINEQLEAQPELVNQDPLAEGWILKLKPEENTEPGNLMDASSYQDYLRDL